MAAAGGTVTHGAPLQSALDTHTHAHTYTHTHTHSEQTMQFQLLMSSRLVRRSHSEGAECVYSVLVTERREGGGRRRRRRRKGRYVLGSSD